MDIDYNDLTYNLRIMDDETLHELYRDNDHPFRDAIIKEVEKRKALRNEDKLAWETGAYPSLPDEAYMELMLDTYDP